MNALFTHEASVPDSISDHLEQLDHCLTVPDLARILSIHKITLYRMAAAGRIPSFKIATAVRFDPRAVAQWVREQAVSR